MIIRVLFLLVSFILIDMHFSSNFILGYPRYQQPPISTVGSGMASSNLSVNRSSALTGNHKTIKS